METKLTFLILGLLFFLCRGKVIRKDAFLDYKDSFYDDIRLTPEQTLMMKEKGFNSYEKWKKFNDIVIIPYYFDREIVNQGSEIIRNFQKAANIIAAETCIRWVELSQSDERHKVRVFRGDGCHSNVGKFSNKDNELSLGQGCEQLGVIVHEMMHTMGLYHTQNRPDRDKFVRVWTKNLKPNTTINFINSGGDLYGVPYDYKSIMHYGNDWFSLNGSYTLTTINPFAMFSIGSESRTFGVTSESLRWSDAAFLNRAYACDKTNAAKCPSTKCMNKGFVGRNCKCKCPENTKGDRCDKVTGDFFSDFPKCGGTINSETEITSFVNGVSTHNKCIFKIVAPKCKLPSITFTYAKFYSNQCHINHLAAQISDVYFGIMYCDSSDVPINKPIVSDQKQAVIYYSNAAMGVTEYGFKARIRFVNDPSCRKHRRI